MISKNSSVKSKIDLSKSRILDEFPNEVKGIYLIGSFYREYTLFSDLDILVIFEDSFFNINFTEIKEKLFIISKEINIKFHEFDLYIWFNKMYHYQTYYPDVSYIRSNLPKSIDRLDSWYGLAKHTLISYEAETFHKIFGDYNIESKIGSIPKSESIELFLISSRTFVDGIAKINSKDEYIKSIGLSHLAKSGLRVAYAAMIYLDGNMRNSYKSIFESALKELPCEFHYFLNELYLIKSGNKTADISISDLVKLFHYVENLIADSPRLITTGLAFGRAGESFAFTVESFLCKNHTSKSNYSRYPNNSRNHYQSYYFLITAHCVVNILIENEIEDYEILDFLFEEIVVISSYAIFNAPSYLKLVLGQLERDEIKLEFSKNMLTNLKNMLCLLLLAYENRVINYDAEWLTTNTRKNIVCMLLMQMNSIHKITIPDRENKIINDHREIDILLASLEWQTLIFSGVFNMRFLEFMNSIGLLFIQAGEIKKTKEIFNTLIQLDEIKNLVSKELPLDQSKSLNIINVELSKTFQYSAFSYQVEGDISETQKRYLKSLDLNADNYSALDDFNGFLIENNLVKENMSLLAELIEKSNNKTEATKQIVNRFVNHAIELKQNKQYEIAEKYYLFAIEIDPRNYKLLFNYGILLELSSTSKALQMYHKAIEINPDYVLPYTRIGLIYENVDDWKNALKYYTIAEKNGIADENIFNNLGNYHLRTFNINTAFEYYKKALDIDNNHADALNGLGNVLMILGEKTKNIKVLEMAAYYFNQSFISDSSFEGAKVNYYKAKNLIDNLIS